MTHISAPDVAAVLGYLARDDRYPTISNESSLAEARAAFEATETVDLVLAQGDCEYCHNA